MAEYDVVETDDELILTAPGSEVIQVRLDYGLQLVLGSFVVAVGSSCLLSDAEGITRIDPEAIESSAAAAPLLFGERLDRVVARRSGELEVIFLSGRVLRVPVHDQYENWQIDFGDRRLWVGLPGGDLAIWRPHS